MVSLHDPLQNSVDYSRVDEQNYSKKNCIVRCLTYNCQIVLGFSFAIAIHLINQSTSKTTNENISERIHTRKSPSCVHMRFFGCEGIPNEMNYTLDPKSIKCIFLSYGKFGETHHYLYDLKAVNIVQSNDIYFNERQDA